MRLARDHCPPAGSRYSPGKPWSGMVPNTCTAVVCHRKWVVWGPFPGLGFFTWHLPPTALQWCYQGGTPLEAVSTKHIFGHFPFCTGQHIRRLLIPSFKTLATLLHPQSYFAFIICLLVAFTSEPLAHSPTASMSAGVFEHFLPPSQLTCLQSTSLHPQSPAAMYSFSSHVSPGLVLMKV